MAKRVFLFIIIVLLCITTLNIIYAQNNNTQKNINQTNFQDTNLFRFNSPVQEVKGPSYFGLVFKTLLILGIFIFGVYYLFKYIANKQGINLPNIDLIKLITSLPVGTNRFIQIIELGKDYFLIGSTDSNITLLKEITDKETINMIHVLKNKQPTMQQKVDFSHFIKGVLSDITKKINAHDASEFLKRQKERLSKLKIKY